MKLFKTNREPVYFSETHEYFDIFKQVFSKVFGLYLSRDRRWKPDENIFLFVDRDEQAFVSIMFFINFSVKLLEETELDPATFHSQYHTATVADAKKLPQNFMDDVLRYFGSMKIADLVKAVGEQEESSNPDTHKKEIEELGDMKSLSILSMIGAVIVNLESVPDEATLDEMMQQPKLNELIRHVYMDVDMIVDDRTDNSSIDYQLDENQFNIWLFDIGHYTKKQITGLRENFLDK